MPLACKYSRTIPGRLGVQVLVLDQSRTLDNMFWTCIHSTLQLRRGAKVLDGDNVMRSRNIEKPYNGALSGEMGKIMVILLLCPPINSNSPPLAPATTQVLKVDCF